MTPGARVQTAIEIIDTILTGVAAEKALTGWARRSRFAGSKDRAAVRDHVFDALRRLDSAAAAGGEMTGRGVMLGILRQDGADVETLFMGTQYTPEPLSDQERATSEAAQDAETPVDVPEWLRPILQNELKENFAPTMAALRLRAPVYLRVNLQQTSRQDVAAELLESGIVTREMALADTALEVLEGPRKVALSDAYLEGRVELQDLSSQAVIGDLELRNGLKVLDYCAGGGGKILAIAGLISGDFWAHDAIERRMVDLPNRAARAGVNVQICDDPEAQAPFDLVFCDVPCSGSGTWRRAPDAKWRFTPQDLAELQLVQAQILAKASGLVGENGTLVYATCSLLRSENDAQIEDFLAANPGWKVTFKRQYLFETGGDGFFAASLTREAS